MLAHLKIATFILPAPLPHICIRHDATSEFSDKPPNRRANHICCRSKPMPPPLRFEQSTRHRWADLGASARRPGLYPPRLEIGLGCPCNWQLKKVMALLLYISIYLVATTILPALGVVSNVKGRQREDGRCTWLSDESRDKMKVDQWQSRDGKEEV